METEIKSYLDKLASKTPTPGGGGVAALSGSLGAALASMVCNLTIGKPKYSQYEDDLKVILSEAETLYKKCLILAEEDETAFEPLSKAYSLPSSTEEEKKAKDEIMEKALLAASDVPMRSARAAYEAILLHEKLVEKGSKMVISDVGVGVQMALAALNSAALNVFINIKSMKNREVADNMGKELDTLLANGNKIANDVYTQVCTMLK